MQGAPIPETDTGPVWRILIKSLIVGLNIVKNAIGFANRQDANSNVEAGIRHLTQRGIFYGLITGDTAAFIHRLSFEHRILGITPDTSDKENTPVIFLAYLIAVAIVIPCL